MRRETVVLLALVLVVAVAVRLQHGATSRLHLVRDAAGNEALVVEGRVGADTSLFLLDTAYAGPPVLSTSYLGAGAGWGWDRAAGVEARYRRALAAAAAAGGVETGRRRLATLPCRAFTSGCTMRLMGIGTTTEAQADMLLCPPVLPGSSAPDADVVVTHPLRGSVHILTNDFLLHRAPCLLAPRAGTLAFRVPLAGRAGFSLFPARFVGGAFCVPVEVGGTRLEVVLDTGAAAALSLAPGAVARLARCAATDRRATQTGVHGERVCSDVLRARVRFGPALDMGEVEVFANDTDVQGADGYAGMGLLRALDLWLQPDAVGLRRSGLLPRDSAATAAGACAGKARPACAATRP